jgi:hypothetical protein
MSFIFGDCIGDDRYLTMIYQQGYVWSASGEKAGDVSGTKCRSYYHERTGTNAEYHGTS